MRRHVDIYFDTHLTYRQSFKSPWRVTSVERSERQSAVLYLDTSDATYSLRGCRDTLWLYALMLVQQLSASYFT